MKKEHLRSLILVIVILSISGGALLVQHMYGKRSSVLRVHVEVEGNCILDVPITEDGTYVVREGTLTVEPEKSRETVETVETSGTVETAETSKTDGNINVIAIEDGSVSVTEANCSNHICVKTGNISKSGETICCLPHRLIITLTGNGEVDGFAY
ncbi:MAG: NusG domain II-containing protein [Lachnospiraceae bacterium]|nr:NusG domain II-containing protein [Lachnospiraceae bacterium]